MTLEAGGRAEAASAQAYAGGRSSAFDCLLLISFFSSLLCSFVY